MLRSPGLELQQLQMMVELKEKVGMLAEVEGTGLCTRAGGSWGRV